ncbi:MAG: UDP-N-acetylmuramate--L-alanine ligase [Bifidobacteriaceae bacterium]|jgi:UDP-N-acetylmuramate--alanine ligase|nr:UDP-N-acetylmuramate--L-alanine ligase [Bifidobacteriaceae bacterium]
MTISAQARLHFMGIGGAGMAPIAYIFHQRGWYVQGSDHSQNNNLVNQLQQLGIQVSPNHAASNLDGIDVAIYSSAIKPGFPEFDRAQADPEIQLLHRSQALWELVQVKTVIAVAGAHGKTSTSAMLVDLLNADPQIGDTTFIVGGAIHNLRDPIPNGHWGDSEFAVIEADESDGSFLNYQPNYTLITSIEPDHLDHFGTYAKFEQVFIDFCQKTQTMNFLCADNLGVQKILPKLDSLKIPYQTYSIQQPSSKILETNSKDRGLKNEREIAVSSQQSAISSQDLTGVSGDQPKTKKDESFGDAGLGSEANIDSVFALRDHAWFGEHNLSNALGAATLAQFIGVTDSAIVAGLQNFQLPKRRLEIVRDDQQIAIVDDYAHHPSEISASLQAIRAHFPNRRLLVIFQPHLYSRTKFFQKEFAEALSSADYAIITGIYAAREKAPGDVKARTIAQHNDKLVAEENLDQALRLLITKIRPSDVVVTMGAGDIWQVLDQLKQVIL